MKEVIMPKFGFTQESGDIVRWLKRDGDRVTQGEPILEVTTDKVNMEVEAPADGILAGIRAKEGDVIPVAQVIAFILRDGETLLGAASGAPAPAPAQGSESAPDATPLAMRAAAELKVDLQRVQGSGPGGRITKGDVETFARTEPAPDAGARATPAARRIAREADVALGDVPGTGPHGRVQADDVRQVLADQQAKPAPAAAPAAPAMPGARTDAPYIELPITSMRRTIALRLQRSAQEAPHISFDADVDLSAAEALRARLNARAKDRGVKVSLTAVLTKACGWALQRHPRINSQFDLEHNRILLMKPVNIGMAVALEDGLVVPVIKDAPNKGLQALAAEIAELGERARQGKLKADDMSGGTFTISNLGMHSVDRFTAIINPPESAILAVGRAVDRFVPDARGQPVVRPIVTLRLSADHRVIDGAVAALFLKDLREALESPDMMLA